VTDLFDKETMMLSESEKQKEIQQWGLIYNLARQRKSLSELKYSPEERVINRVLDKIEKQIAELKGR